MKGQGYKQSYVEFWAVFYFCSDLPNFWHATRLDNVTVTFLVAFFAVRLLREKQKPFVSIKFFCIRYILKTKRKPVEKYREMFS